GNGSSGYSPNAAWMSSLVLPASRPALACPGTGHRESGGNPPIRRAAEAIQQRSFGLGSTTPLEMVRLCAAVYRKQILSPQACDAMLAHLRACEDKDKFPRFLPPGTRVAFKTGSLDETRTAAGIIECPGGPVALCVMTSENQDKRWVADNAGNRLCAEIARAVYDQFDRAPPSGPKSPARPEARH
ncbi:MAG: serine hydrolase, partial [Isosphaeraceae bacterium]